MGETQFTPRVGLTTELNDTQTMKGYPREEDPGMQDDTTVNVGVLGGGALEISTPNDNVDVVLEFDGSIQGGGHKVDGKYSEPITSSDPDKHDGVIDPDKENSTGNNMDHTHISTLQARLTARVGVDFVNSSNTHRFGLRVGGYIAPYIYSYLGGYEQGNGNDNGADNHTGLVQATVSMGPTFGVTSEWYAFSKPHKKGGTTDYGIRADLYGSAGVLTLANDPTSQGNGPHFPGGLAVGTQISLTARRNESGTPPTRGARPSASSSTGRTTFYKQVEKAETEADLLFEPWSRRTSGGTPILDAIERDHGHKIVGARVMYDDVHRTFPKEWAGMPYTGDLGLSSGARACLWTDEGSCLETPDGSGYAWINSDFGLPLD